MIYSLSGKMIFSDLNSVAIDVNGIAFRCAVSNYTLSKLPSVGESVSLFTHLNVREDSMELFGFIDKEELECFKLLLSVSGVGPKAAISILSQLTPSKLSLAIAAKDFRSIQAAQGIGKKTAERVVLELKDKLGSIGVEDEGFIEGVNQATDTSSSKEAIEALVSLGYTQSDAAKIISKADKSMSTEDLIKFALKQMI